SFLGINQEGRTAIVHTRGNPDAHVVLRGGREPNYAAADIGACEAALAQAGLAAGIMVDCSHANCGKDAARQPDVAEAVVAQMVAGDTRLIGLMLESHLEFGRQPLREPLRYGVSITDPCIDWQTTEALVRRLHAQLGASIRPAELAG
ncbi:MAG TPA: 3-deoxy-7-phosphoheptulonate synthase, partial [Gammaproteobacteria bacterium]|nr:3-deoxy-7-phosphoheptulonate synthase [Gammaproteobacteria bacterium]